LTYFYCFSLFWSFLLPLPIYLTPHLTYFCLINDILNTSHLYKEWFKFYLKWLFCFPLHIILLDNELFYCVYCSLHLLHVLQKSFHTFSKQKPNFISSNTINLIITNSGIFVH
jgi:hypothetical protein